jgi:hypothetical protein
MHSNFDEQGRLINPAKIYEHIESWRGEDFDDKLIDRIANAPIEHQSAFQETLLAMSGLTEAPDFLPELPRGVLRPAVTTVRSEPTDDESGLSGLRLLLYTPEIVLDAQRIHNDFDPRTPRPLTSWRIQSLKL